MYERVFVRNKEGELVLQDLLARFHDRPIWIKGEHAAERETLMRAAQQGVMRFILGRIGQLPELEEGDE